MSTKVIDATTWLYEMMQGELEYIYYNSRKDATVVANHMDALARFLYPARGIHWGVKSTYDNDKDSEVYWVVSKP